MLDRGSLFWIVLVTVITFPIVLVMSLYSGSWGISFNPHPTTIVKEYVNGQTTSLNCAGAFLRGQYYAVPLTISNSGYLNLIVWSSDLPPSDFYVYIMTPYQYQEFENGASTESKFSWDLTQYSEADGYPYYLNQTIPISQGNYFLVFSNSYSVIGAGVYGQAYFTVSESY